MKEVSEHRIYRLLADKYERVEIDYVLLSVEEPYDGEATHKKAIPEALDIIRSRYEAEERFTVLTDRMRAERCDIETLLMPPDDEYDRSRKRVERSFSAPEPLPYWYAFLEPPHGTPYTKDDFAAFQKVLLPDRAQAEAYRWNDDFSDYFDAGKEGWGTGLWTIYDRRERVMIVIGASLTD